MLPFYRKLCAINGTLSTFCGLLIKADTHITLYYRLAQLRLGIPGSLCRYGIARATRVVSHTHLPIACIPVGCIVDRERGTAVTILIGRAYGRPTRRSLRSKQETSTIGNICRTRRIYVSSGGVIFVTPTSRVENSARGTQFEIVAVRCACCNSSKRSQNANDTDDCDQTLKATPHKC